MMLQPLITQRQIRLAIDVVRIGCNAAHISMFDKPFSEDTLRENPYIFTFYSFPKSIWRSIYSTNLIESFNKQIKKYTKRKEQFPHEEALEKFLVAQFEDYNQRLNFLFTITYDTVLRNI